MSAISSNAIAPAAPVSAKAKDHDAKAPAGDAFAALLNAAHAQTPPQPAANDKNDRTEDKAPADDAQATANDAADSGPAQAGTDKADTAKNQAPGKPQAKDAASGKSANDNDPPDALAQQAPQAETPDAVMAAAQSACAPSATVQAAPAKADHAEADKSHDGNAVDAAKAGVSSALQAPAAAPTAQPGAPQTPAAAAQAGITGTNNNGGNKNGDTGKDGEPSDKAPAKPAGMAKTDAAEPPQPAQNTAAPSAPAAASFAAHLSEAPAPGGGAHPVSTAVEVTPQSAHAAPDVNGLGVEIAARSQNGARQFSIRLDPPELGRVDVRLSIDATGKAQAHLTADHPEALSLLQKDSGTLTQALRQAGLDVSQDGLNFSLRSQNGQAGQDQAGNGQDQGRGAKTSLTTTRVLDTAPGASSIRFTGAGNGRLDIHV